MANRQNQSEHVGRNLSGLAIEEDDEEGLLFDNVSDDLSEIDDRWLLVGRFLTNRPIDFQAMQNKIATLWQPGRGLYVKELEPNLFLFQFYHEVDIERVIEGSPWTFDRAPLVFERVKTGENPRQVALLHLELWVQLHNMTTGFMSERIIQGIGNYIGTFLRSDPNNFMGVWRDYLRIRVKIRVDVPLKKKKKLQIQGGPVCHATFKYEDLPTFCFICGVLGHTERFCERLFDTPKELIVKNFDETLRAVPRRRRYADGSRWLKTGLATKSVLPQHKASGSNNGGGGGSPVTAANLGQQMSIPNNQGSHLLPNIQGNNGADLIRNFRGKEKEDGLNNVKSLETGEVIGEKQLLAPTGENSKNGLTFLENKRRRTGLSDIIGPDEDNVDEEQYKAHDNILYADMEITKDSEKDLQGLLSSPKNSDGAGLGFQARQSL
ncbi:hypothetical protein CsatA_027931 [Cannabis sativa]